MTAFRRENCSQSEIHPAHFWEVKTPTFSRNLCEGLRVKADREALMDLNADDRAMFYMLEAFESIQVRLLSDIQPPTCGLSDPHAAHPFDFQFDYKDDLHESNGISFRWKTCPGKAK